MSHKRKDTFVADGEWRQHLRPEGKRAYHKAERRYAKNFQEVEDPAPVTAPPKSKQRKRYGVRLYRKEGRPKSGLFANMNTDWTSWYKTEKARDQAYDKVMSDLDRLESCKGHPFDTVGHIFRLGDAAEKVQR